MNADLPTSMMTGFLLDHRYLTLVWFLVNFKGLSLSSEAHHQLVSKKGFDRSEQTVC